MLGCDHDDREDGACVSCCGEVQSYLNWMFCVENDAKFRGAWFGLASFGHAIYFGEVAERVRTFMLASLDMMSEPNDPHLAKVRAAGHAVTEIMLKLVD